MDATAGAPAYTAQNTRQALSALMGGGSGRALGARSGWRPGTPDTVVAVTSTTWTLHACSAIIDAQSSTTQGAYEWASDADITGSVTAADATNPRTDILYIQINDSSAGDGSGALNGNVYYLAGTPATTPAAPALPARSFLVATISVPKVGGGNPTIALNHAFFAAAGAPQQVYSQAERDALTIYPGLSVERMDLGGAIEVYDGTRWSFGMEHAEFHGTQTVLPNQLWGPGILPADSSRSVNGGFASFPSADVLQVSKEGIYSISMMCGFSGGAVGTTFLAFRTPDGTTETYATTNVVAGAGGCSLGLSNLHLSANQQISCKFQQGTGGNQTWDVRVRITRMR
jgi:hypothetical protein